MLRLRFRWLLPACTAAAALCLAALTAPAHASPVPAFITHKVTGCGRPMTSYTPRVPGTALAGTPGGQPSGPGTVLGIANADHVRWVTWTRCISHPGAFGGAAVNGSKNWGGYQDSPSASQWQPNPYVQALWVIPAVGAPNIATVTDYSSAWVGLGDGVTGQLLQDGTEMDTSSSARTYFFWGEAYPAQSQQEVPPSKLAAHPGDSVGASTFWDNSVVTFTLCDYTTKLCVEGTETIGGPDRLAEWIVERTEECIGGHEVYPYFSKFGKIPFSDGGFGITSNNTLRYDIGQGDPKLWTMFPGARDVGQMTQTSTLVSNR
jgi:hypothetical protein